MVQLSKHFGSDEHSRHSEWLRQQSWFIKSRREQEKKQEASEKLDEDILDAATEAVLATEFEIAEFEEQLDIYDEASVKALMENQALLDEIERHLANVNERLAPLFASGDAQFMDDGRRVFLTADRNQAYDEFGSEISNEEYGYDLFPADHEAVDPYISDLKLRGELIQTRDEALEARQGIHDFEAKVNEAKEELQSGKMTQDRLEELSADLDDLMPPEVGMHLPDYEPPVDAIKPTSEFMTPDSSINLDTLKIAAPGLTG